MLFYWCWLIGSLFGPGTMTPSTMSATTAFAYRPLAPDGGWAAPNPHHDVSDPQGLAPETPSARKGKAESDPVAGTY